MIQPNPEDDYHLGVQPVRNKTHCAVCGDPSHGTELCHDCSVVAVSGHAITYCTGCRDAGIPAVSYAEFEEVSESPEDLRELSKTGAVIVVTEKCGDCCEVVESGPLFGCRPAVASA